MAMGCCGGCRGTEERESVAGADRDVEGWVGSYAELRGERQESRGGMIYLGFGAYITGDLALEVGKTSNWEFLLIVCNAFCQGKSRTRQNQTAESSFRLTQDKIVSKVA